VLVAAAPDDPACTFVPKVICIALEKFNDAISAETVAELDAPL
jgi:hypothetical protein